MSVVILIYTASPGVNKVYIGDHMYGPPTSITAKHITMSGQGDNEIIFNNNMDADKPGTPGYLFSLPIEGDGRVIQQSGHTTLSSAGNTYNQGTTIQGGFCP